MYMYVLYLPFHHIFMTLYSTACFFFFKKKPFFPYDLSCNLAFVVNSDTGADRT